MEPCPVRRARQDRPQRAPPFGALFAVYLVGYGIGRILIETVRIDPVNDLLGVRLHIWTMAAFIVPALVYLWRYGLVRGAQNDGENDDEAVAPTKPQAPLLRKTSG